MIPGIHDFHEGLNHQLAAQVHAAQRHAADDEHEEPAHSWVHSFCHGVGEAAIKFVAEAAFDDAASTVLGDAAPHAAEVGSPHGGGFTAQTTAFTCAVVSQKMVLDQFHLTDPRTGHPLSEAQLTYDATVHGWLTDHGTGLADLGRLLEHYGVATHVGHDWSHLVGDLARGHQVVVAVNADTLWAADSPWAGFGGSPNHALVLKGLKVDDHGHVVVIVHDPGRADGAGAEYALDHFQSALGAAALHYVATDAAPPDWHPPAAVAALAAAAPAEAPAATYADTIARLDTAGREAFLRNL